MTGGSQRLGRATVLALARAGADLVIHYNRSGEAARDLCDELRGMGRTALALGADLDEPAAAPPLFREAWEALGGLDCVVNNASIFPPGRLPELELDELIRNVRINAWAPFVLGREFWRRLRGSSARGAVVNLLDTRLVGGDPAHAAYHLSKALLAELTTLSALELSPELRVNAVAPGAVLPPEDRDDAYLEGLTRGLPLQRRGYPADVADATLYLLGASFVTGQVIYVDGGRHIREGGGR